VATRPPCDEIGLAVRLVSPSSVAGNQMGGCRGRATCKDRNRPRAVDVRPPSELTIHAEADVPRRPSALGYVPCSLISAGDRVSPSIRRGRLPRYWEIESARHPVPVAGQGVIPCATPRSATAMVVFRQQPWRQREIGGRHLESGATEYLPFPVRPRLAHVRRTRLRPIPGADAHSSAKGSRLAPPALTQDSAVLRRRDPYHGAWGVALVVLVVGRRTGPGTVSPYCCGLLQHRRGRHRTGAARRTAGRPRYCLAALLVRAGLGRPLLLAGRTRRYRPARLPF